jgi:hypothetical protein
MLQLPKRPTTAGVSSFASRKAVLWVGRRHSGPVRMVVVQRTLARVDHVRRRWLWSRGSHRHERRGLARRVDRF